MKKKIAETVSIPEFQDAIDQLTRDEQLFVNKSMEIANYIAQLMASRDMLQKDLATSLGKSEAEISKWLTGLHNFTLRSLAKLEVALGTPVVCVPNNKMVNGPAMNTHLRLGELKKNVGNDGSFIVKYSDIVKTNDYKEVQDREKLNVAA
jgi:transcriptional regulator with XRE-family HTH domain